MNNFFENLKHKLSDFGEDVAAQTRSMTESAKLSARLSEEEKKLKTLYQKLGQAYYARTKLFPTPEDKEDFAAIAASLEEAKKLRREIAKTKGKIYCTSCGRSYPEGTRFCPNCGTALFEQEPKPETEPQS